MQKNFRLSKFLCNNRAQVLPYFLIMAMVLLISWAMLINIAKVIRDRMVLQNNLDNAVISVANLQARTLNLLGLTNEEINLCCETLSPIKQIIDSFPLEID